MRLQIIQIGRKACFFIIVAIFLNACEFFKVDDLGDYSFSSFIFNSSNDTLFIVLLNDNDIVRLDTFIIPGSNIPFVGHRKVNKEDDVLTEHLFHDSYNDSHKIRLYRDESLVVEWLGPAEYMGDTINHFYNYDSWNVELINDEYILEFTIFESDYNK